MAWILDSEEQGVGKGRRGGGGGWGVKTVDKTVSHFFHRSLIPSPAYAIYRYICDAKYILGLTNDDLQGKD